MRRLARQRTASVAIGTLLSVFGSSHAGAGETRLIATCQTPAAGIGKAQPSVSCDVRVNSFAVVEHVKAALKGRTEALETSFKAFDTFEQSTNTAYLIQLMPNGRRSTLTQIGDAVVTLTDRRQGKRRFSAYTYGNELSLIAGSGASKAEFVRQIIAVKPATTKVQLYKAALQAVEALAAEGGDRKALVILGDGTSDDTATTHDQVVKAAKAAGVAIHGLGYYDDRASTSKFSTLSRLAEDTGGYATEVKQPNRDLTKQIVTNRFASELLENGGTATVELKGPAGTQTLVLTATRTEGASLMAEAAVDVPVAPQPAFETTVQKGEPEAEPDGGLDIPAVIAMLAALGALGALGYRAYAHRQRQRPAPGAAAASPSGSADADQHEAESHEVQDHADTTVDSMKPSEAAQPTELLRPADGHPAVYGWLETVDGNGSRHALRTTSVRVGRHRDNDICLQNDSISRRHAVLHYDAGTRRVVITDLGGGNGVIVNRARYKSRELNDGDMVELGEVRLRFRAETEFPA